jgi:hypothetical protein
MAPKFNLKFFGFSELDRMSIIGPEGQFVRESSETETKKTRMGPHNQVGASFFHLNCVRAATQFRPGGTAICQLSNFDSKIILKFVSYFYENLIQLIFGFLNDLFKVI